jgi:hypothetical protein
MNGIYHPLKRLAMRHELLLTFGLLFFSARAPGQDRPCEVDLPVNIVMPDAALVRHVPQGGFIAQHGHDLLVIRSVQPDTAPRRIVLVVENGKNVNPAARKVEASVLSAIVTNARAKDSFALLTAHGPRSEIPFGTKRDVLLTAIGELSLPAKGKQQGKPALDAVLEAAGWLQPPEPGDSIIFLTMGLEPGAQTGYGRVSKRLTASGIRLFGFQLGMLYVGIYSLAPSPGGGPFPMARIDPNQETIFDLAEETGGFFMEENTEGDPQLRYQLTDDRLEHLAKLGGQLYKAIVEYYRIRLGAAPMGFSIELTDAFRQQLQRAHVAYPREVPHCSPDHRTNPPA